MNSIVFTHIAAPAQGVSHLDIALERLGAWLDAERETLGRVLAQASLRHAAGALDALTQLHLEPTGGDDAGLRDLLEDARAFLEILFETMCALPSRCRLATAWGIPGPAPFDTHVRWSAARLHDMILTLDHALAA